MQILLANPRGFCAGVDRAIDIVERAIELFGAPIYVRHEVVHNRYVVERLRSMGAVFVEELDEVPDDATVIFSAHGVARAVQDEARRRDLKVFDATCPLVTKVHMEVSRYAREGREVILIGHEGHPEVEGTMGQFDTQYGGRIVLVETPEDVDRLDIRRCGASRVRDADDVVGRRYAEGRRRLAPSLPDADDAAQGRYLLRDAESPGRGEALVERCDIILVVGSPSSSNSNRLREIAEKAGIPGYLIDGPEDMKREWFEGKRVVGVTAGASAPEVLVERVVARLRSGADSAPRACQGQVENVVFSLPRELRVSLQDNAAAPLSELPLASHTTPRPCPVPDQLTATT